MWLPSAQWRPPGDAYVDVWRIPAPLRAESFPQGSEILSPEELARMEAFVRSEDRDRFHCAHVSLRRILSLYIGTAPQVIRFDVSENGKPCLAGSPGGGRAPEFNLSHSGAWVLIALGGSAVGVDVEVLRSGLEWREIAKEFLPARTIEEILAYPPERRPRAYFQAWTCLEAYFKGLGTGLSRRAPEHIKEFVTLITRPLDGVPVEEGWQVRNLDLDPEHASALAWMESRARIRQWTWTQAA